MAGFEYRGQLNGAENPVVLTVPIAASSAVKVGDAVKLQTFASGSGVLRATGGSKILGVVQGIVNNVGIDLDNADPASFAGTWASSTGTYTASSANMTVKTVSVLIVVDKNAIWYNDAAGDFAAADIMKAFDLADQDQVADQNGADAAGALRLIKLDPDGDGDASKGLFIIVENDLDAYVQQ